MNGYSLVTEQASKRATYYGDEHCQHWNNSKDKHPQRASRSPPDKRTDVVAEIIAQCRPQIRPRVGGVSSERTDNIKLKRSLRWSGPLGRNVYSSASVHPSAPLFECNKQHKTLSN